MKTKKEKLLILIAYSLFGLIAFILFFLATFPFSALEEKGLQLLEAKIGCVVTMTASRVSFPVSITWEGIDARCPKKLIKKGAAGQAHLKVPALNLSLALWPLLLKQQGEIDFNARWGGGTLSGHLTVTQEEEEPSFVLKDLKGDALEVKEIDPGISGRLTITGEGRWRAQEIIKGTGRLIFSLDEAKLRSLGGRQLPVGEISFAKIQGKLDWKEGRLVAEQFSATGAMVDLKSESGTLVLRKPLNRSLLALSLLATPKGSIKQMASMFVQDYNEREPLKLRLNGPLGQPKISVNGRPVL